MNNTANRITILRIVLIPVYLLFMYLDWVYPALAFYIIACITDYIDGFIARKYDQVTVFGKFMDPLADKLLVLSAMCFFIGTGIMPAWAVVVVLIREFAVSGLRLIAVEQDIVIAAAVSAKVKTVVTMVCVGVLIAINEPWMPFKSVLPAICIALILITTLYSGIQYFVRYSAVFKNCK